jgi:tetratricopeptide (TPR) repeat protein
MIKNALFIFFSFTRVAMAQSEQLAQNYFERGEFEKAQIAYEELAATQPSNYNFFQKTIECYQQLEWFDKAEAAIQSRYSKYKTSNLLVELGYNYQLQKNQEKAQKQYQLALDRIQKNPIEVYQIAAVFEKKSLLDYALQAYQLAITKEPKYSFNYQMGLIYGQKGQTDLMIERFLEESFLNQQNLVLIQNQFSRFLQEDVNDIFSLELRKALLVRVQKSQDLFWNEYLSWYYIQQKEYSKAFIQQKAIFKRNPEVFSNIANLDFLAMNENEDEVATEIFGFVIENTKDLDLQIQSHTFLMQIKIKKATAKEYESIDLAFNELIKKYGVTPYSFSLLKLKAHFVSFYKNNAEEGKSILKNMLQLPLNRDQLAQTKMELADILLFEEKFNQALLYYSQIEADSNNNPVGQEASLKIAKTSYYKADFDWAEHQLKILKSATTQLIANDAMDLFLLLTDAKKEEDSLRVALTKFSRADFLHFQNKNQEAIAAFKALLEEQKGSELEPATLLRMGTIYQEIDDIDQALLYYNLIIANHKESIYIDEANYFSGELLMKKQDNEQAKLRFEQIIMNHPDSIYYVDAKKKYRKLRGDKDL